MSKDKKSASKMDDATMWKHMCIAKGLDVVVMEDKCRRLEMRSMRIEDMIESLTKESDGKIAALEEIVDYLNSEEARKDELIKNLNGQVEKLTTDMANEIALLNKKMEDLSTHNEFEVNTLNLQLEAANIKLREMHDFAMKKQAMEQELIALKEQLAKEQRDHAEAISDVERNAVQERERLKKEIQTRVEETKIQMTRLMEEQLHQKTKRTITENEQLRKEVAYHIRQTDILMHKKDQLMLENTELHRSLVLAKEIEEDLSRRNHMYQKTTRILVFKLREVQDAVIKEDENYRKEAQEAAREEKAQQLTSILNMATIPSPAKALEVATNIGVKDEGQIPDSATPGEEAMKFLYACLEDLELERLMATTANAFSPSAGSLLDVSSSQGRKRLDQLTLFERQSIMKKLMRAAEQLNTLTDEMVGDPLDYSKFGQALPPVTTVAKSNIRVDDILAMPTDFMHLDDPGRVYQWKKPTTVAVQADMSFHARRSRTAVLF